MSAPRTAFLLEVPETYICPIMKEVMRDPVVCADGHSYERLAIERWFSLGRKASPLTQERIPHRSLIPNLALRSAIDQLRCQMPEVQRHQIERRQAGQEHLVDSILAARVTDDQAEGLRKKSTTTRSKNNKRLAEELMEILPPSKMAKKWRLDPAPDGLGYLTPKQLAEFENLGHSFAREEENLRFFPPTAVGQKKTAGQQQNPKKQPAACGASSSSAGAKPGAGGGGAAPSISRVPTPAASRGGGARSSGEKGSWVRCFNPEQLKRFEALAALDREAKAATQQQKPAPLGEKNAKKQLLSRKAAGRGGGGASKKKRGVGAVARRRQPVGRKDKWTLCFSTEQLVRFSAMATKARLAKAGKKTSFRKR